MRKFFRYKITTVALLFLVALLGSSVWHARLGRTGIKNQVKDLEAKISRIEKENEYLEQLEDYHQSSLYLEKQARARLNYKSEGENVVFVYPKTSGQDRLDPAARENMSNYLKWWYYLTSKAGVVQW
jgi:cell division protein FtsB